MHPTDRPRTPILEVCVDSVDGLDAAIDGGAGRVELCSALSVGGLTPSTGLMAAGAAAGIPCFVLIRPSDIDQARSLGLAGVVIGASSPEHELDEEVLRRLITHATGLPVVLHRAFDLVSDSAAALESAVQLGFRRVLTSGGAKDALTGCETIRQLVTQAGDRIEVMAGAGVRPDNVADLMRRSGVTAVHSSCSSIESDAPGALGAHARALGFYPPSHRVTDPQVIRAMLAAMQAA
jgi:copper homeostasis protein